jgi:hypothetical protein
VTQGRLPPTGDLGGHHADDPLQVVDRAELHDDAALGPTDLDLDLGLEPVREPGPQLLDAGRGDLAAAALRGRLLRGSQRDRLLGGTDAHALGDDAGGQGVLRLGVLEPEQRPCVSGGDDAGGNPGLHLHRQLHQPDRVRDLRATATDLAGQLLVGGAELLEQLLVGGSLLERVELDAVDVLQQGVAEHGVVGGVPDDGRHGVQAGDTGRPQAALAHDEFVTAIRILPDDDRLEQPELPDGVAELLQRLVVEDLARLLRVGDDVTDGDLAQLRTGNAERTLVGGSRGRSGGGHQAHRRVGRGSDRTVLRGRHRLAARRGRRLRGRGAGRRRPGRDERRQAATQAAALVHGRSLVHGGAGSAGHWLSCVRTEWAATGGAAAAGLPARSTGGRSTPRRAS